jgi:AraC family L-rhamnose operon transcriptional activator RhaR/AraC family L-rhamnose operon regulatory protein RhaS
MKKHFSITDFFDDPALPLAVHRRTAQRPKELHTHDFSELVLVQGGGALHFTEKDEHPIRKGDVFVIQGELAHGYRDSNSLSLINLMFDQKRLNLPSADLRSMSGYHALFTLEPQYRSRHRFASRLRLNDGQLAQAAALAGQMEIEAKEKRPGYIFNSTALFMQLIIFLARCYDGERTPESRTLLRIGSAIGYLEDHYYEQISVKALSKIAGMSESSLLRAFKQATDRTPTEYLLRLRLRRARHLLRRTDLNITEIAFETGFQDSNYFTRQFRKQTGCSPREYRNSQKK